MLGPLGQVAVEGEVYRGGFGVPREHQGGCTRRLPEERDEGGHEGACAGDEGEEGGPGPPRV